MTRPMLNVLGLAASGQAYRARSELLALPAPAHAALAIPTAPVDTCDTVLVDTPAVFAMSRAST